MSYAQRRWVLWGLSLVMVLVTFTGCSIPMIKGTKIPSTKENRAIVRVIRQYRRATLERRPRDILALVSTRFLGTNGTPDPKDDIGYPELRTFLLSKDFKETTVLRFDMKIRDVKEVSDKEVWVYLSMRLTYRFPRGKKRQGLNTVPYDGHRILLTKEGGRWLIRGGI